MQSQVELQLRTGPLREDIPVPLLVKIFRGARLYDQPRARDRWRMLQRMFRQMFTLRKWAQAAEDNWWARRRTAVMEGSYVADGTGFNILSSFDTWKFAGPLNRRELAPWDPQSYPLDRVVTRRNTRRISGRFQTIVLTGA